MSEGDGWTEKYGGAFLEQLVAERDWRTVEALWRWTADSDVPSLALEMARSDDSTLARLVTVELLTGRFAPRVPDLPELLQAHAPHVTADRAAGVLQRLIDPERPLPAEYGGRDHLLIAWLMHQPGERLDELAVDIALGDHPYSGQAKALDAALDRVARSQELGATLIGKLGSADDKWGSGPEWTRTADIVGRCGSNPRGRAELVRRLALALVDLPDGTPVEVPPAFVSLLERHAGREIAELLVTGDRSDTAGVREALRASTQFSSTILRDDVACAVSAHQPALWALHRTEICAGWSVEDWSRMLARWSIEGAVLASPGEVLHAAPPALDAQMVPVAIMHGAEPGDLAAQAAASALTRLFELDEDDPDNADVDIQRVVQIVPWHLVSTEHDIEYIDWILQEALDRDTHRKVVVTALDVGLVSAEVAAGLLPEEQCVAAFSQLASGELRGGLADALWTRCPSDFVVPLLNEVIAGSDDIFDVIDKIAAHDSRVGFGSFDEDRWHRLSTDNRDRLIGLLETHGTLEEVDLLDLIAGDSDGMNSSRRARAARRWADLSPLHGDIPVGVFSLLDSARPDLNQTFAQVAATVQPRDERTLLRLREKWVQGGKIGADARTALDAVAAGAASALTALSGPDRRAHGPALLRILGLTAAPDSFDSLISHVGPDAVDDDLGLRRTAAVAVRTFVDATQLASSQLGALGAIATAEPDAEASEHLMEALAAAHMGEDAAILLLYDLAGLAASDVEGTPDELFGDQKPRLLTALKRLVVQKELGQPGWEGYVEQMDLIGEALVRAAYLRFGDSDALKSEVRKNSTKPDYGVLVKALARAKGFDSVSVHLQALHDMRSNRTAAHHPNGGPLDEDALGGAVNALETAAREIIVRLQNNGPLLRAVEDDTESAS